MTADRESEEETERRARRAAQTAFLCGLVSDDEFRSMADTLRVSFEDRGVREQIGVAIYAPFIRNRPRSKKQERINLQEIHDAASCLHDALERMNKFYGTANVLLGFSIEPIIFEMDDDFVESDDERDISFLTLTFMSEQIEESQSTERRFSMHNFLKDCQTLRDCSLKTIDDYYRDPRFVGGRPPDRQRDEVAEAAAQIFHRVRGRRPTLTTQPPLENRTTYGGEFYKFASIMDAAFLRIAKRNPDRQRPQAAHS
jgi:hypothetical protein